MFKWFQKAKQITPVIQSELKKVNARIANLVKRFGSDSDVVNNELSFFYKEPFRRYMTVSGTGPGGGRSKGKKKKKSVALKNPKFDISKLNKDIRSGSISLSDANNLLIKAAGLRIERNGDITKVTSSGINTVSGLKKQAQARLEAYGEDPEDITPEKIEKEIKREVEIKNSFQTEYDEYIAREGVKKAKRSRVVKKLWDIQKSGGSRYNRRLSYQEIEEITKKMKEANKKARGILDGFVSAATEKDLPF